LKEEREQEKRDRRMEKHGVDFADFISRDTPRQAKEWGAKSR
jgi:uncharacterized DUF497 family protein